MAFPTELRTLRGGETRGQRTVMVVGKYDDGTEFAESLPEGLAELLVATIANGWSPAEIEVERLAVSGVEMTPEIIDLRKKRVVSVRIKYSEAESSIRTLSHEEAGALDRVTPNFPINPLYEQRKPLLQ